MKLSWNSIFAAALIVAIAFVGCGKKDSKKASKKNGPYYDYGAYNASLGGPYLSSANPFGQSVTGGLTIQNTEAYSQFLKEIAHACGDKFNKGIAFFIPFGLTKCSNLARSLNVLAVDIYTEPPTNDGTPPLNSPARVEFFLGSPAQGGWGYQNSGGVQWAAQIPLGQAQGVSPYVAPYEDDNGNQMFRILLNVPGQPKLEIRIEGNLTDLLNNGSQNGNIYAPPSAQVTIEYANKPMARGRVFLLN